jgi:hypothetical protein
MIGGRSQEVQVATPQPAKPEEKGTGEVVADLVDLLKNYARQETVDPLKSLGRFVGFGAGAAVCWGIAGTLIAVGALRVVQVETRDLFDGNWTWVPYIAALVLSGVGAVFSLKLIKKRPDT